MNIALDYDGTYTEDPGLWDSFIRLAVQCEHAVFLVTMRNDNEMHEVYEALSGKVEKIINTSRKAKRPFMDNLGIHIDVWIDDMPHFVDNSALR